MALFVSSSELSQCSGDAALVAEKADSFIRELYKELDKHQLNLQSSKRQLVELVENKDIEISEKNATIKSYLEKIVRLTENAVKKEARISEIEADLA